MELKQNKLWIELCKEIPYEFSYALSHLIDPTIFHIINEIETNNKKVEIYVIYDANNQRLLIFDNGSGLTLKEIYKITNFETTTSKGWKQWIRAMQWLSNNAKIYSQRIDEENGYIFSIRSQIENFEISNIKKVSKNEFVSRTKFTNGLLMQIDINKKLSIKEFQMHCQTLNSIYQKYVNLDKVGFKAIYRQSDKFFDCSKLEPAEINSYRKAEFLKHIQKPEFFEYQANNKKLIINEKIDLDNRTINIKGYAAILKNPNCEISGIYCYSSNKLIMGALPNSTYKPYKIFGDNQDNEFNSLYAEIEFTNVPISITGDKFKINEITENKIVNLLTSILGKQGETNASKSLTGKINTVYQSTAVLPIETIEQYSNLSENIIDSLRVTNAIIDVKLEQIKKNKKEVNLYTIKDEYGKEYKIQLIRATNKEASGYWIKKKYADDAILVYFNYEHPFFRPIISSKRSYNAFCEFIIYYIIAEERAINEGASVEELKILIDNYLRKGN